MSRTNRLFLRVRDAPVSDYDELVIRIHKTDKPQDIRWGDYINISLNGKNWITCQLERSGDTGMGRIYINSHLRGFLNRYALGIQGVRLEIPCDFYIRKASSWKESFYIMHYHPNDAIRAKMRLKIYGIAIVVVVTIVVAFLVPLLYLTGG